MDALMVHTTAALVTLQVTETESLNNAFNQLSIIAPELSVYLKTGLQIMVVIVHLMIALRTNKQSKRKN